MAKRRKQSEEFKPATPTEYKGTVYRSKSEAMFARWLELQGRQSIYEPKGFEVSGWNPDFLSWWVPPIEPYMFRGEYLRPELPMLSYELIEYKPSRPTQTYIKSFDSRCAAIWQRYQRLDVLFLFRCSFHIYYGSVYTSERGVVDCIHDSCLDVIEYDWIGEHEEAIRNTRFDLES